MKVKIVGKKSGTFTSKDTGEVISFGKLHCIGAFPLDEKGTDGDQCLIISCNPNALEDIPVPCDADLDFNQWGRLASVEVIL